MTVKEIPLNVFPSMSLIALDLKIFFLVQCQVKLVFECISSFYAVGYFFQLFEGLIGSMEFLSNKFSTLQSFWSGCLTVVCELGELDTFLSVLTCQEKILYLSCS